MSQPAATVTCVDWVASLEAFGRQGAEGVTKIAEDLARYRTVIHRVRPGVIVETGSAGYRSARWFAQVAGCPVVTIDVASWRDEMQAATRDGVVVVTGSSVDPDVVNKVSRIARNAALSDSVMVVLDSDHSAGHVFCELEAYAPLVTPGSYLVCEDGIVRHLPPLGYVGSPLDAIERFLPDHPEFRVDYEVEAMFPATMFPSGWLRRPCLGGA